MVHREHTLTNATLPPTFRAPHQVLPQFLELLASDYKRWAEADVARGGGRNREEAVGSLLAEGVIAETTTMSTEAQTIEGETIEAQIIEGETIEAETIEAQTIEAETIDEETIEAETIGGADHR
eukprot:8006515-Pyramimonas_sp.AAC.1